jgi:nitroimidazol reductase NimA-like FMN-containing flavoprotein (pyridoxamine 5'-phosphate oxidase superfamily)
LNFNKAEIKMPTPQPATAENAWVNTIDGDRLDILALARQLISEQIYGTLSTCSPDGMPWGTPLFFVYDEVLNFYWSSAIAAQHSQNLYANQGRAMITIYDATKIKAVYFSGVATELTEPTKLAQILKLFDQRAKRPNPRLAADYLDQSPRRMYQFAINEAWVSGDRLQLGDQLIDTKIQLNLATL